MPGIAILHKRKSPVIKKLETSVPAIRSRFGVTRIGIFGSFARGEQTRTSDVDVLVVLPAGMQT
ncbi:nucleotidyltransferase family protein [Methanoregula sp.]|uniref:nucleotidyltransferase family protein n=1 Tax=Methanoregula sp. TaxID=2052170 RepID=UPI003BB1D30C